jgi:hypothetical protein
MSGEVPVKRRRQTRSRSAADRVEVHCAIAQHNVEGSGVREHFAAERQCVRQCRTSGHVVMIGRIVSHATAIVVGRRRTVELHLPPAGTLVVRSVAASVGVARSWDSRSAIESCTRITGPR